jgi:hypothetical protein
MHWGEESSERAQNLPVLAQIRPWKDAQLRAFYVNLNNVRFSDDAGRACCHDSVEPQTSS